jgi:hypothetical protein
MSPANKKLKQIFNTDGKLIYEGKARSVKELIGQLIRDGRSLRSADLSGQDLSHMDLSGADFRDARLDGAVLNGAVAGKVNGRPTAFDNASMRGVQASGLMAESARFIEADLGPLEDAHGKRTTTFHGATLSFARFDGAKETEVDFSLAAMSSSIHAGAVCEKSNFSDSTLHNVEWGNARIVESVFDRARMSPTFAVNEAHLPDRTKGAVIVGNRYEKTEIGLGNSLFRKDAMVADKIRKSTVALVTSGIFITSVYGLDLNMDWVKDHVGSGALFILAASAYSWIRTPIEDKVKDWTAGLMANVIITGRTAIAELWRRGAALGTLASALLSSDQADHVEQFLKKSHCSLYKRFKAAANGEYEVVICDRKNLSEALVHLSAALNERQNTGHSVVLVRSGDDEGQRGAPRIVVLNKDKSLEIMWDADEGGNIRHEEYDPAKIPAGSRTTIGPHNSHIGVMQHFVKAIVEENGLPEFKFDHTTHFIRMGRDKSIVVVKSDTGRLDNRQGPTIITPDDKAIYYRNSVPVDDKGRRISLAPLEAGERMNEPAPYKPIGVR